MQARLTAAFVAAWALSACGVCRADIFFYVDPGGVSHFSNVPVDRRYALLLASPEAAGSLPNESRTTLWLSRAAAFDELIDEAAHANAVQPALVRALIVVESGFNPRAQSKRGAMGLMQLLPATARRYGVRDLYDPKQNIRAGVRYLSDLMTLYDSNTELALAAYNAGEAAIARYGGHIPPYPETQRYVPNVLKVYHSLSAR